MESNAESAQPQLSQCTHVQQVDKIALEQIKCSVPAPQEGHQTPKIISGENDHLLGGQQHHQQCFKGSMLGWTSFTTEPDEKAPEQQLLSQNLHHEVNGAETGHIAVIDTKEFKAPHQRSIMTQYGNTDNTQTHTEIDIREAPGETQQEGVTTNTIILKKAPKGVTPAAGDVSTAGHSRSSGHWYNPSGNYKGPKVWQYLTRHWYALSQWLALLAVFVALWMIAYVLLPDYALPYTTIMRIVLLFVGAQVAGTLVTFLRLPDMLGMLFFGVLYTNVGLADFSGYQPLEAFLREMALINIMLLAGLGLDAKAFKKLWLMILRLTLVPTLAEVAATAVVARFLLGMPWAWGILLGLVVTAVSPNVVVTVMLKLKEDRLGLNNGIHTLIYAMTSCNDVIAIFLFGVVLGIVFSTGTLTEQILQGPIGIGIGIVFGYVYGLMLTVLPSTRTPYLNGLRFVLTVLGGTVSVMGSRAIGYPSAGALGCMTIAFFASIGWKRQQQKLTSQERNAIESSSVSKRLDLLWRFLKPVSFALIGKEINFNVLDCRVVGYGALLVLLGSLFRLVFAYISTYGGNLSRKERAYITISGFPKATVQAALGPVALDLARSLNAGQDSISLANKVLIISVLAIIFTAPLGAILMLRLAPRWLERSDVEQDEDIIGTTTDVACQRYNVDLMNARNNIHNLSYRSTKTHSSANAADDGSAADSVHTRPPHRLV